jgi:hypothetical protein
MRLSSPLPQSPRSTMDEEMELYLQKNKYKQYRRR